MKKWRTENRKNEGKKNRKKGKTGYRLQGAVLAVMLVAMLAGCQGSGAGSTGGGDSNVTAREQDTGAEQQGENGGQGEAIVGGQGTSGEYGKTATYDENDLDASWDESQAAVITCDGINVQITGEGVTEAEGVITIKSAGTYVLRGSYEGQLLVDAEKDDVVRIVMDGFRIYCENTSPVYGLQSEKIVLILAEGTENFVSDGAEYVFLSADEDEPDAAVFSKDDLTINGAGTLTVNGNYSNGIRSKDDLKLISGILEITAAKDGIKGKDSVTVKDGQIQITSAEDGIKSNNDTDPEKGYVIIEGGVIQIQAGDDGIHGETWLTIYDGDIDIQESVEGLEGLKIDILGGSIHIKSSDDGINGAGGSLDSQDSQRAKMEVNEDIYVRIAGGTVYVNAMADGIDSNGNLYMEGGAVYISGPVSGGDGALDYNGEAYVNGGVFAAAGSAGMMQTFSQDSGQNMVIAYFGESQEAGTQVVLRDEDGKELLSYEPDKAYECILISVQELEQGKTYTLAAGSGTQEIAVDRVVNVAGEQPAGRGMGGGRGRQGDPEMVPGGQMPEGQMPGTGEFPEKGERPASGERPDGGGRRGENPASRESEQSVQ